jgi:hypothetical protein
MNILKLTTFSVIALTSCCLLGGCGSSDSSVSPEFEKAVRAPKGQMPPEAVAAMQKGMASQNKNAPVGQPPAQPAQQ